MTSLFHNDRKVVFAPVGSLRPIAFPKGYRRAKRPLFMAIGSTLLPPAYRR